MTTRKMKKTDEELISFTDAIANGRLLDVAIEADDAELGDLFKTVKMLKSALCPAEVPKSLRRRVKSAVAEEIAVLDGAKRQKSVLASMADLASAVTASIRSKAKKAKELVLSVDLSGIIAEAIAMPRPVTADVFAYSADVTAPEEGVTLVADRDGHLYEVPTEILKRHKVPEKKQRELGLAAVHPGLPQNIVLNINLGKPNETAKRAPSRAKGKEKS